MTDIFRYGRVLRAYQARGSLRLNTNHSFQCSFDAVQFVDGAIRVQCRIPTADTESNILTWDLMSNIGVQSIRGITEDNQEITLSGQILWTNVNHRTAEDSKSVTISLVAAEVLVEPEGTGSPLHTLKFGITNFEFEGNIDREQKTETSHRLDRGILAVNLPLGEIRIERLPNYEVAMANLKATQGIEPTCEMSVELSTHDIQWAKDFADDLCTILSLAKGTKIVWIYLDGYDGKGVSRLAFHKNAITRPYAGASASVVDSIHPSDIKELIEKGYERFAQLKGQYKLGHIIDAYLESKRPHSYLESRGLAAIQAMELLAAQYAEKHNLVYIMDENEFGDKLGGIGTAVNEVFQKAFGESYVSALCGEHNEKLKSLNRRTLRQVLKQVFQDFVLIVPGARLHALIETRNALVHRGSFNTNDKVKEYYCVISIMDRLLLKMLGYAGYFLDCEKKWARVHL